MWFVIFEFNSLGYVKDDEKDKLDAKAILESIKTGTEQSNEERRKRGWATMDILGWHTQPRYDPVTNNLTWAIRGSSEGDEVVNYSVRLLGRKGVMDVDLVLNPTQVAGTLPEFDQLMTGFEFTSGNRYAEFMAGDKVAEYGLTALVAGGAGAVLAKSGLLAKMWKLLVVGALAAFAAIKKMLGFGKKQAEDVAEHAVLTWSCSGYADPAALVRVRVRRLVVGDVGLPDAHRIAHRGVSRAARTVVAAARRNGLFRTAALSAFSSRLSVRDRRRAGRRPHAGEARARRAPGDAGALAGHAFAQAGRGVVDLSLHHRAAGHRQPRPDQNLGAAARAARALADRDRASPTAAAGGSCTRHTPTGWRSDAALMVLSPLGAIRAADRLTRKALARA